MKVWLLWVGLFLVHVQADETTFNNFLVKYNKVYINSIEQTLRKTIFDNNLQKIEEHNKKFEQGLVTYKLGVNNFTDLTEEEFAARFKTLVADESILKNGQQFQNLNVDVASLPKSIDWRTYNGTSVVTQVKNQGTCGGCWAFSTTGTIEAQLAIQTGELVSLSEQQLLDCDRSNAGCDGGVVQQAYLYMKNNGLTLGSNYPYVAYQRSCRKVKSKVWTTGYVNIRQYNETDLKVAVATVGPVSVAINAQPIQSYQSGIFSGYCSSQIDHGVLAVGYGTDPTTQQEYWILKNSWGSEWGENGYFRIALGRGLCGIARQACYPLITTNAPSYGNSVSGNVFYLFAVILLSSIRLI